MCKEEKHANLNLQKENCNYKSMSKLRRDS